MCLEKENKPVQKLHFVMAFRWPHGLFPLSPSSYLHWLKNLDLVDLGKVTVSLKSL